MVEKWSEKLTNYLMNKNALHEDYMDICCLGIEVLISTSITCLGILLIGILFGCFIEAIIYCLCFITIRNFSGGYHAKSRIGCNLGSWTISTSVFLARKFLGILPMFGLLIGLGLDLIVLVILGPLENKNKPLSGNIISKNRKWMIFFVIVWDIIAVILYGIEPFYSMTLFYTEVAVVILIIIEKRRQNNERKQKQQIMQYVCKS